jgi:hypothetical protein
VFNKCLLNGGTQGKGKISFGDTKEHFLKGREKERRAEELRTANFMTQ